MAKSNFVNGITVIAEVQGSAQKPYRIGYNLKQYTCSCPAWTKGIYSRNDCKHVNRVKAVINGKKIAGVTLTAEGHKLKAALDNALNAVL
jgi:uncharacterized Zn finger protein